MVNSGTRMTHVPYKGIGPAYADLFAGTIEVGFPAIVSSVPHIRAGRLRPLAVTLPQRSSVVPELPTIVEAGVPGVVMVNWYGLLAPLNTPRPIVERLSQGVKVSMTHPEVVKRLVADGSDAVTSTPEQTTVRGIDRYDALLGGENHLGNAVDGSEHRGGMREPFILGAPGE